MNDYDLLGLMDTHKAMKNQGVDVPNSFAEFLTGITPVNDDTETAEDNSSSGDYN